MQRAQGFAQQGGETAFTAGLASTTLVQASFPLATITVYYTGTTEPAFIYSDNQQFPTPMSNPFHADANGHWFFYAPNGRYDVMIASPELDVPWTIGDILLNDSIGGGGGGDVAQTPWLSNIDGGGFNLSNVGYIDVTGGYLINGVPMANPNLWVQVPNTANIYHQGFIGVAMTNPNFAVDVAGGVNVTDNFYINGVAISSGADNDPWIVLPGSHIQYNGMVGINIAPAHALDVVGDVNITGNYLVNGVALGTGGGSGPWAVLTGSRINYNGQVGINNANPGFALDVVGSVNVTQGFFINGVALSTSGGAGLWIPTTGGVIFYNGGPVGIGTNSPNPAVGLQVAGIIAGGQFTLSGNPTAPVINQNGQFLGAGVAVGSFGISGAYMQANVVTGVSGSGNIVAENIVEANTFVTTNFVGQTVINVNGAFVGAGVNVTGNGGYGISGAYIQANVVTGIAGSGNVVAEYIVEANTFVTTNFVGQTVINVNGAFVGAGVDVTGNGGYGIAAAYIQANVITGVAGSGNVVAEYIVEANTFVTTNFVGQTVINVNGAFVGAGVDVTGNGGYGVEGAYIQANVVSGVSGSGNVIATGFLSAASGLLINGVLVINSAGQFLGAVSGALSSLTVNGQLVINGNGTLVGTGGVSTSGTINTTANVYAQYIQSNGDILAGGNLSTGSGVIISGFVGQPGDPAGHVINSAGAFVGAGVNVGAYGIFGGSLISSGPVECQQGTLAGHPPGALFTAGDSYLNGLCAAVTFSMYNNPGVPVIDSTGAFRGASVLVPGGIQGANIASTGNITANGIINSSNEVIATTGYLIGSGLVINGSDQFVGVGGVATIGAIIGASFALPNNPGNPVINTAGAFVGAGVQVGGYGISGGNIASTGNITAQGQIDAQGAIFTSGGYYIGSGIVINTSDQFVGVGGVATSGTVQCQNAVVNQDITISGFVSVGGAFGSSTGDMAAAGQVSGANFAVHGQGSAPTQSVQVSTPGGSVTLQFHSGLYYGYSIP